MPEVTPQAAPAPPATFLPNTMGRPEDGKGKSRWRVEDGYNPRADSQFITPAERQGGYYA